MEQDLRDKVMERVTERAGAKRNKTKKICQDPGKDQANTADLPAEKRKEREDVCKAFHKNKLLTDIKSNEKKYCSSIGKWDPVGSFWSMSAICNN
jgi:hypothetical protein